jgi:hypothetical protein
MSTESAQKLITRIATDAAFRTGLDKLKAADKLDYLKRNGFGDVKRDDIMAAIEPALIHLSPKDLATGGLVAAGDTTTTVTTTTAVYASAAAAVAAA